MTANTRVAADRQWRSWQWESPFIKGPTCNECTHTFKQKKPKKPQHPIIRGAKMLRSSIKGVFKKGTRKPRESDCDHCYYKRVVDDNKGALKSLGAMEIPNHSTAAPNDNFYNDEGVLNSTSPELHSDLTCKECGIPYSYVGEPIPDKCHDCRTKETSAQPFTRDCYICGKPITEFITIGQRAHVECAGNEVVKEVEADDDE